MGYVEREERKCLEESLEQIKFDFKNLMWYYILDFLYLSSNKLLIDRGLYIEEISVR